MKPLPFLEAIAFAKKQGVVLPSEYYGERVGLARAQARTISGLAGVDQIQHIFDILDQHLASGGSFKSFQNAIAENALSGGLPKHRLELIYRNNIQTAYSAGRWQQVERNKDSRPYLRYIAVNDGRTRPSHRAMHGHIAKVDDGWWNTHMPQNGHRCRCTVQSLSEKQAKARGYPNKTPSAKPDKGWDYNAGKTPMHGLQESAKQKKKAVNPVLKKAVEHSLVLAGSLPMDKAHAAVVLSKFIDDSTSTPRKVKKRKSVVVGEVSSDVAKLAALKVLYITITSGVIEHMLRVAKQGRGQALSKDNVANLATIISDPKAILLDLRDGDLLYIFAVQGESRLGKIVIRANYLEGGKQVNSIRTGGLVDVNKLKDMNVYKVIKGSL